MADLPDVSTRHMRPQRGVQDDSAARAIEGIGNLALEVNKEVKLSNASDEFNELEAEVLGQASQEAVEGVGKQIDKLAAMKSAGMSEEQYRIRAETILTKNIARAPALAREFRQRAGQALGFDPTGAATDALFSEQKRAQAAQVANDAAILRQGISLGADSRDFASNRPQFNKDMSRALDNQRIKNDVLAQKGVDMRTLRTSVPAEMDQMRGFLNAAIDQIPQFQGKRIDSITAADIASMDESQRKQISQQLINTKLEAQARYIAEYDASPADITAVMAPVFTLLDNVTAMLDPANDLVSLQNSVARNNALVERKLQGTKLGAAYLTLTAAGAAVSPDLTAKVEGLLLDLLNGRPIRNTSEDADPDPVAGEAGISNLSDYVTQWAAGVDTSNLDPESQETYNTFVTNFSKLANDDTLSVREHDLVLKALGDPKVSELIRTMPNSDAAADAMDGARTYAIKSSNAASSSLIAKGVTGKHGVFSLDLQRMGMESKVGALPVANVISIETVNGQVRVTSRDKLGAKLASELQKKYADRINTAIRAMSGVTGKSPEESAADLYATNPTAFSWIQKPAPLKESKPFSDGDYMTADGVKFTIKDGQMI